MKLPINLPDIIQENQSFEVFAANRPHEAFLQNRIRFCDYVRNRICSDLTDYDIENLLNIGYETIKN